jgi:hypothetical protein
MDELIERTRLGLTASPKTVQASPATPADFMRGESIFPQGLKPAFLLALSGTAEAVPFPNRRHIEFFSTL